MSERAQITLDDLALHPEGVAELSEAERVITADENF